jgi:hypothetical protein
MVIGNNERVLKMDTKLKITMRESSWRKLLVCIKSANTQIDTRGDYYYPALYDKETGKKIADKIKVKDPKPKIMELRKQLTIVLKKAKKGETYQNEIRKAQRLLGEAEYKIETADFDDSTEFWKVVKYLHKEVERESAKSKIV